MTYLCANPLCQMSLIEPRPTRSGDVPAIDDIVVCGACRTPSILTAIGTRLLTKEDLSKAPPKVHKDLRFAIRALDQKLKQS